MEKLQINADPSKKFFIEMLTRDISLIDCILDLIDNSVDSIIKAAKFDPMKGLYGKEKPLDAYKISVNFNKTTFSIVDNSIGITKSDAENKVFRFGSNQEEGNEAGLSVYGIGMKRSFLKIGREINFKTKNKKETIEVDIDVLKWLKSADWDFSGKVNTSSGATGTVIKVSNLYDNIISNFKDQTFENRLLDKINEVYGIFLLNKLKIEVNGKKATPVIPKIAVSAKIKPSIDSFDVKGVHVKIIAGLTHEDSKSLNGWYVFCNGRLILSGDKTDRTGWGGANLRQFHSSVNRFVGFAYFESSKVSLLPWTTTKDGVNFDSVIYQYALNEMVKTAQPIVSYLTNLYKTDKNLEGLRSAINISNETPLNDIKINKQSFSAPSIIESRTKDEREKISYTVSIEDMKKIRKIIGNNKISNTKIGEKTFYYFIEYES